MRKFNLGLQLYSVRNEMAADFEGTLAKIADMGYKYVEFAGYHGKSAEELRELLDKYGLVCESVHQKLTVDDAEKAQEEIDFLKKLGVKYVVIPWFSEDNLAGTPNWENTVTSFRKMAELLHKNGMMLGYHNHEFEFKKFEGKYLHDYIFEAVDADKFFPELDTCWVRYADIMPEDKIREFSGRVPVVHLKDLYCTSFACGAVYGLIGKLDRDEESKNNNFQYRPVGYGIQDFDKILEACDECGTHTVIVEQDEHPERSALEDAKLSADYLRSRYGL